MASVNVLILRGPGTNCDLETQVAWEKAGARAERVHVRALVDSPELLRNYQVFTLPGGFSYGDDIAAGKIMARRLQRHLREEVLQFVERGGLVLGICNGFQTLVKAGLLPDPRAATDPVCTVTFNDPPGFVDRWVRLRAGESNCAFLEPGREYDLPIAHGEGRVLFESPAALARFAGVSMAPLRYVPGAPQPAALYNPNGSQADIAGMCDQTGRIFALMPHPERFVDPQQHPCWTSRPREGCGDGLHMFTRAVRYLH